jgi:hypothetical protein
VLMPLLTVRLRDSEYEALQILARSLRRPTRDQLAVLVADSLAAVMATRQLQEVPDRPRVIAGAREGA